MNTCKEHLGHCQTEGDVCLQCIVTGDESWAHFFQPETKRSSQEWQHPNSLKPKKFCAQLSLGRVMLHCSGTVRGRFWSITILGNHKHPSYCGLLVDHQKPEIWSKCQWLLTTGVLLLHDNARSRTAYAMVAEFRDLHFECLPHPPYSTDIAPSDFHLFGALNKELLEASSGLIKKFKRQCMPGCASNLIFFFKRDSGFSKVLEQMY